MGKPIDPDYILTTAPPAGNYIPPTAATVKLGTSFGVGEVGTLSCALPPVEGEDPCNTARRTAATATMTDTCKLGLVTQDTSTTYETETVVWSTGMACGFRAARMDETDGAQASTGEAEVRLPYGTACTGFNRVQITHRGGVAITPIYYRIKGEPDAGPTATRLRLIAMGTGGAE